MAYISRNNVNSILCPCCSEHMQSSLLLALCALWHLLEWVKSLMPCRCAARLFLPHSHPSLAHTDVWRARRETEIMQLLKMQFKNRRAAWSPETEVRLGDGV